MRILLFLTLFIHTHAYSGELNHPEGICGPEAESANECAEPTLPADSVSSSGENKYNKPSSITSKKGAMLKTPPLLKDQKRYTSVSTEDSGKSAGESAPPAKNEFVVHFFLGQRVSSLQGRKSFPE